MMQTEHTTQFIYLQFSRNFQNNWRSQVRKDLRRPLVQPLAENRVSYEVEPGCSRLYPVDS